MKALYVAIAYGCAWISVSLAVSVGVYYTHNIHCLWFLLVPLFISIKTREEKDNK